MLTCLTQQHQLLQSLADQLRVRAERNDVYFCLAAEFSWLEGWLPQLGDVLVFNTARKEELQRAVGQWGKFSGDLLLISGLEKQADPQTLLVKLAQAKQQRCPDRHFHWLVLVAPAIEEYFRGLQTFLDGKSHWWDLRLAVADLEQTIEELWRGAWVEPSALTGTEQAEVRSALPHCLEAIAAQGESLSLEPVSLLQGKLALLQGLAQESQGEKGRAKAYHLYQESLDVWQLLGDSEAIIWLSTRLAYLSLLQAHGERNRGHQLWQQTRHHAETAIATLEAQQWRFAHGEILNLIGQVLRGLEDWEQLRQGAENFLIFLYQLSPFAGTDTSPERSESKPWTDLELQGHICQTYTYLTEALVEQWKFDEASEALQRAWETYPKQRSAQDYGPEEAELHYLTGRIQLANDKTKEALKILEQARSLVPFSENPRLYLAILVELRECHLQLNHWIAALAIDQEYQQREYAIGQRAFIGPNPLPCWPEQRLYGHPLAPEKVLGAVPHGAEGGQRELSANLSVSLLWQELPPVWAQQPMPVLVLTGEPGGGKTSWLGAAIRQELSEEEVIFLPFDGHWGPAFLARLEAKYSLGLTGLDGAEPNLDLLDLTELRQTLATLPILDLLLILDGDNGTLPWQNHEPAPPWEPTIWQWLLLRPQPQDIRLLVSLPPTAIADFQAHLKGLWVSEQPLPPLQYQTIPPLTLAQAESWLAQAMAKARHPWSPSLQSQVLGDLALETGWKEEPWLHPIDLQLLGSVLEQQQITQSVDYQGKKLSEWLTLAVHKYLSFLPTAAFKKALQLLKSLTDGHYSLCLKTDYQLLCALYSPQTEAKDTDPAEFAPADLQQLQILLSLLSQGRLVSIIYQGTVPYYRLSTPHLAHALQGGETSTAPVLINAGAKLFQKGSSVNAGTPVSQQQGRQDLIADLEAGGSADEQVAAHKLKVAEAQYRKLMAGINLERQALVILKQFLTHPLEALLAAVQTAQELQRLIALEAPLGEYPSLAPYLALHNILAQIQEYNRLQHPAPVTCLAVSPARHNGPPLLLTGSSNGLAYLWSFHGELIASLRGHQGAISTVEWSADGQYFATASADHTVKLWQSHGEEVATLVGHDDAVRSVHFSPQHQFLITGSRDNTVRLWNFVGEQLTLCEGHVNWVRNAEFNPNGQILLSASRDGTARLWDLEGREIARLQGHTSWVRNAKFSPDGQSVLTASADGTARLWDLGGQCYGVLKGHQNWVRNALWSPDGQYIVTASSDGTARLWSAQGKCLGILQGHDHAIHEARFSPDSQRIITCSTNGTVRIWSQGGTLLTTLRGHQKDVYEADFSEDGRFVFTVSADYTARQWDISPKNTIILAGHAHWVRNAHINAKGDRLLTASRDKTARLWNLDGECLAVLEGHPT